MFREVSELRMTSFLEVRIYMENNKNSLINIFFVYKVQLLFVQKKLKLGFWKVYR